MELSFAQNLGPAENWTGRAATEGITRGFVFLQIIVRRLPTDSAMDAERVERALTLVCCISCRESLDASI
jgi:hypothetical protein